MVSETTQLKKDDIVIMFIGPTGHGKSHFINLLTGDNTHARYINEKMITKSTDPVCVRIPHETKYGKSVVVVDTPGWDATEMSDYQTLTLISNWVRDNCKSEVMITGIVYLRRINENRENKISIRYTYILKQLCGKNTMNQAVLVTTHWSKIDPKIGEEREKELATDFWNSMIKEGASMDRLKSDRDHKEAWRIVDRLIDGGYEGRKMTMLQQQAVKGGFRNWLKKLFRWLVEG